MAILIAESNILKPFVSHFLHNVEMAPGFTIFHFMLSIQNNEQNIIKRPLGAF